MSRETGYCYRCDVCGSTTEVIADRDGNWSLPDGWVQAAIPEGGFYRVSDVCTDHALELVIDGVRVVPAQTCSQRHPQTGNPCLRRGQHWDHQAMGTERLQLFGAHITGSDGG